MTSSNSSQPPAILLDTCVISGLVRNDMRPEDAAAFMQIAAMVRRSELTICASTVALEEIEKIPEGYRAAHLREYQALRVIQGSNATWLEENPESTAFGTVARHPDFARLTAILRDENDARLIFQGKMAGVTDFVTVDYNSVLNKAGEIRSQVGVVARSPSQYIAGLPK